MKFVIVGSEGYWGSKLTRVIRELGHEIAGEINLPQDGAAEVGWYGTLADAAIIASPAETHHAIAKAAMVAGLDVLVEKPAALSRIEVDDLDSIARATNSVLSVDSTYLHTEAFARLKQRNSALRSYQSVRLTDGPSRVSIPAGWDLVVHDVAILEGLGCLDNGWPPISGHQSFDGEIATASIPLRFGGRAEIIASRAWVKKVRSIVLIFEDEERFLWDETGLRRWEGPVLNLVVSEKEEPLKRMVSDFAERCRQRRTRGLSDMRHATTVVTWLEKMFGPGA